MGASCRTFTFFFSFHPNRLAVHLGAAHSGWQLCWIKQVPAGEGAAQGDPTHQLSQHRGKLLSMTGADDIDGAMSSLLREMHAEGHIDNQFEQLLMLQDDSEPDFVRSVMELFFQVRDNCGMKEVCDDEVTQCSCVEYS